MIDPIGHSGHSVIQRMPGMSRFKEWLTDKSILDKFTYSQPVWNAIGLLATMSTVVFGGSAAQPLAIIGMLTHATGLLAAIKKGIKECKKDDRKNNWIHILNGIMGIGLTVGNITQITHPSTGIALGGITRVLVEAQKVALFGHTVITTKDDEGIKFGFKLSTAVFHLLGGVLLILAAFYDETRFWNLYNVISAFVLTWLGIRNYKEARQTAESFGLLN